MSSFVKHVTISQNKGIRFGKLFLFTGSTYVPTVTNLTTDLGLSWLISQTCDSLKIYRGSPEHILACKHEILSNLKKKTKKV